MTVRQRNTNTNTENNNYNNTELATISDKKNETSCFFIVYSLHLDYSFSTASLPIAYSL